MPIAAARMTSVKPRHIRRCDDDPDRGGPAVAPLADSRMRAADAPHRDDVLAAIGASFDWLCTRPHPVCVDGRAVAGLPDALIPLDELRGRVTARACPLPVSDAVWAHLAARSRVDGGELDGGVRGDGVADAAPGSAEFDDPLRRGPGRHRRRDRGRVPRRARGIDLGGVALFASLRWAAYRAGLAAVHAALDAPIPLPDDSLTTTRTNRGCR